MKKWMGDFGKDYTDRNTLSINGIEKLYKKNYGTTRTKLNEMFLRKISRSARILEVGVNVGNQLLCLQKMGFKNLYGIEPQEYAVESSKKKTRDINIIKGNVFDIPFKDNYFDLVFTSGVLIHISPKDIKKALKEVYRCSRRYIWGFEYYSEKYENIIYRGKRDLLWKTDFSKLYRKTFNDLKLIKEEKVKYLDSKNIDTMFLLKKVKG
jgi:pseudaminic acid biosynthesis-associated methylase